MQAGSVRRVMGVFAAGDFSDPTNERIIYLTSAGLAVLGLALLIGTMMWWRRSRTEHPVLAPLEVMSERSWIKAADNDRHRRLEAVRASGAGALIVEPLRSEPVDLEALVRNAPPAFDDLRDPEPVELVDVVEASAAPSEPADALAEVHVAVASSSESDDDASEVVVGDEDSVEAVVDATSMAPRPYDDFADLLEQPAEASELPPADLADLDGLEAMASSPNDPLL